MPDSRPRITFDKEGVCNACQWAEEKKTFDWSKRWGQLVQLCKKHKRLNPRGFNCIVPVSGGKDSSYVAWMMKHKLGMTPLCVTVNPPLQTALGKRNLENFISCGFDVLAITPNPLVSQKVSRKEFIEHGQPLHSWMINVQAAILRTAVNYRIPFIIYGEEGETEYGGTSRLKDQPFYDIEYSKKVYLSGYDPDAIFKGLDVKENERYWWTYPSVEEFDVLSPEITHWSYFENWDSYKHYMFAKTKCGLEEKKVRNISTYTGFAQNDTFLYDLHCHLMFLKFGFGRCTTEVGIDIRRGAMTREEAVRLVCEYDGEFPSQHIEKYLSFFKMSRDEFDDVLKSFTAPCFDEFRSHVLLIKNLVRSKEKTLDG
jgi:N-acetyl sugar amidotransferase